jgi:hypothetical protein
VEQIADAQGDLGAFRTLQKQPAWRGRPTEEQLRRWLRSGARRKIRYARFLVEALDLSEVPRPLDQYWLMSEPRSTRRRSGPEA